EADADACHRSHACPRVRSQSAQGCSGPPFRSLAAISHPEMGRGGTSALLALLADCRRGAMKRASESAWRHNRPAFAWMSCLLVAAIAAMHPSPAHTSQLIDRT